MACLLGANATFASFKYIFFCRAPLVYFSTCFLLAPVPPVFVTSRPYYVQRHERALVYDDIARGQQSPYSAILPQEVGLRS